MGGVNTLQDLDKFLKSPLPNKQKAPAFGPPPPPGLQAVAGPPKPPLPEVKNVQDLDSFLKEPLSKFDATPIEKWKAEQQHEREHPEQATIHSVAPPRFPKVDHFLEKMGDIKVAGDLTLRQAWKRSEAPLGDTSYEDRSAAKYQQFLKEHAGKPLTAMAGLEALGFGVEHAATGMLSPQNMLLLAGMGMMNPRSAVKMLVDAGFSAQMAWGFVQNARAGINAFQRGDALSGITAFTDATVSGAFSYLSGKEAVHEGQVRARAVRMRDYAVGKLNEISQSKFQRPWNELTPHEQAELTYNLANDQNAPITSATARRMGTELPQSEREKTFRTAQQEARDMSRGTAAARGAVPPREMPPPPAEAAPVIKPIEDPPSPEKGPYQPVTGGVELPDNQSMYMTPDERSQQYYTLEEARKRLDEERRVAAQEQETRATQEGELQRVARERREQFEAEKAYRETKSGRAFTVTERRGLAFDNESAEANAQERTRLTDELDRMAQEHMYVDAEDMFRSLDTTKMRGRELEDWQKNVVELERKRQALARLSDPRALEPKRTELFKEDMSLAKREADMREAAVKIEAEAKKQVSDPEEFERMSAEAEEARKRAEDIRTERDKKEAERSASTAEKLEYPLGAVMPDMLKGSAGNVILPDGRKVPFHYAVVPNEALISSHDPFNNFEPNPDAIAVSQGRDYKNNRESQAATIARGKNPEMELLINSSPTAETGAPIVRSDGQGMGGRNRINIWKLLYKNGFGELAHDAMVRRAGEFGIDAGRVTELFKAGRNPVLVRVLDDPYTSAKDIAQLGRDLDRTQTMGFNEAEEAVMAGRSLSDKALEWMSGQLDAMGDDASLRDLMRYRGNEVVERMLESGMISPTQRAEYITGSGEMTEKAKNLFESAVLGKVIDDPELLQTVPKEILRKLDRSVAALARVKSAGGLWDFTPELKESLRLWKRVDSVRETLNEIGTDKDSLVDKYLNPGKYKMGTELMNFGDGTVRETPHPTVEALAKLLEKSAKEVKFAIGDYADDSEGRQITLGPAPTSVQSFNQHIGNLVKVDVPDEAWGVMRPKVEETPQEAAGGPNKEEKAPEVSKGAEAQPEATGKPVLPDFEPGRITVSALQNFLEKRPGIGSLAQPMLDAMGVVVKNATGMDLGEFVKEKISSLRTDTAPDSALSQSAADAAAWARRAGRKLTITPYGEQLDIFGGAEPQFLLRSKTGDERLLLKSELMKIRDVVPRLQELVDRDGNINQGGLFGAEEENLFGPGDEEDGGPQGMLFQDDLKPLTQEEKAELEKLRRIMTPPPPRDLVAEGRMTADFAKWEPPPELGAFPDRPDVGAKARASVDKETGPLKRGEERRKIDRTNQKESDRLFALARKELGDDAPTEEIQKRAEAIGLREVFEKSKSVGQKEADWFTKAKQELYPDRRELTNEEIGKVSQRALKLRAENGPLRQGKRGAVEFAEDGKAILHLFEGADPSTFLHEFFHVMRRYLKPEDQKVLEGWLKVKDGLWSREDEENAAKAWEYYHHQRPVQTLPDRVLAIFKQIQTAMRQVYERLKGSGLVKPSKEVAALFDRWYGKEMEAPPGAPESKPIRYEDMTETQRDGIEEYLNDYALSEDESELDWNKAEGQEFEPRKVKLQELTKAIKRPLPKLSDVDTSMAGQSKTPGPIILDDDLSVIDGMHRLADAVKNKTGEIDALVRVKTSPVEPQVESPEEQAAREIEEEFGKAMEPPPTEEPYPAAETKKAISDMESSIREGKGDAYLTGWAPDKDRDGAAAMKYAREQLEAAGWKYNPDEKLKEFTKDGWYAFLRSQGDLSSPILQFNRIENADKVEREVRAEKKPKAKAKPKPEAIEPLKADEPQPLSAEERKSAKLRGQAGILPLGTDAVRNKVFESFDKATQWAKANKEKIKGAQLFELPDGRAFADFTAKKANVLFQSEHDMERERAVNEAKVNLLQKRLQGIISDAERSQINRAIRDLKAKTSEPARELAPPPGQIISLWTPEGERPVEVKREPPKESRPTRKVPDEAIRLEEPPRPRKADERPTSSGVSQPKPATGGGVRTAPAGKSGRASSGEPRTTLRDVRPVAVKPVRPRGEAAYSESDWSNRVERYRLPENAPAPTRQISDELGRMLMPGQREVVESIVSGLDQHDGYILATTTGTGKTYMGSAVIADLLDRNPDAKVLVLTPSQSLVHGRDGWIQVAGNFGVEMNPMPVGEIPDTPGVFIKTWAGGIANREIEEVPWDLIVMDEVQEARKWWSSQRGEMSKTMGQNAKKIMYTSATPFHTALEIGHMGKLGLWGREGFEMWAAQNGLGVYRDKAGNLAGGNSPLRLEKLRQQLIERGQMINIDRNMDGYSAHFGKVPMDGVTQQGLANIDKALQLAENYFATSGKKGMIQATKAQRTTLAKRWLEYQRLPQAIELGKKLEKEGWKVVFFSENKKEFNELFDFLKPADEAMGGRISQLMPKFKNTTDVLRESFGDDVAVFAGKHSAAREAEKDAFNDDTKSHLYATYGAGGVGVSLHDRAGDKPRAVIYLGPPWSGISFDQALGRPWRYGTKSNVRAYFLFSDSQAEMDLVTTKVAPRMESLRAMVSGVNFEDPVVKNLRAVPDTQVAVIDYDHGNAHDADFDKFTKRAESSGVSSYADLPIVSAEEAKNKGMKLPGSDGAQDPSVIRLWQDSADDEVLPAEFEAPELTLGRSVNVELAQRFIDTGAAPGRPIGRMMDVIQRRQLADAILARAEGAASKDPASAVQQVYTEWENGMKQMDAILSGDGGGNDMEPPPPLEGVPGVPGGEEPTKLPEKIGKMKAFEWYALTNGRDVIRDAAKKAGVPEIGDKIARSIAQYHVEAGNISGPWTTEYWDILTRNEITPEEHKVLALTLANREKPSAAIDKQLAELRATAPMNERIERAVKETQALFNQVFKRLQDDNIYLTTWDAATGKPRNVYYNEFSSGSGYFPRRFDYEADHRVRDPETGTETVFNLRNLTRGEIGATKKEAIVRGMMDRYGLSRAQVEDFLQSRKRDVPLMGNIERAREADMPFFRTDPDVVVSYLEGAGELLSRKKYFAQDGSKVKGLIAQIPDQKARNITAGIVESLLKRNPMADESRALLRFAADWSVMKMTFSAIKVLGHPVHGALLTNIRAFGKGLFKGTVGWSDALRKAQMAGSIAEQTKIEMLSEFGINKKGLSSTLLKWNGWQGAYKWGRVVADATARVYLRDYAIGKLLKDPKNEVVRRQLREFMQMDDSRIDAAITRRRFTEDDMSWAGKAFSDKVMFTFDPTELPPWWRARAEEGHPAEDALLASVRVMTLLKSYQFKTHALLKDAIWDEAKKGNYRPLLPFVLLYPAAGTLLTAMSALAAGRGKKYIAQMLNDKSWTPGQTLWRMVDGVAHMIGDTQLTAWLDAAVHGNENLSGAIPAEYFMGALPTDVLRTLQVPSQLKHAKTDRAKKKVLKRYVGGTIPAARTLINVFEPPPAPEREPSKPLPHLP